MRFGDLIIQVVAGAAALTVVVIVVAVAVKLIQGAKLSMSTFGLSFLTTQDTWDNVGNHFGALNFIYGTLITSLGALILATPLAIGIALFLSELAPGWIRGPVTALVETLAAIPSVIIGLWGIFVLAPMLVAHVEPFLHTYLGFIPLFGPPQGGSNLFTAIIVLTIMIIPIISSISRELFLGVPPELKEAALGLGTTRWEMIRGVVLPYSRSGIAAAMILGLGRAVGEAIAVLIVAGGGTQIVANLFAPGDTLAAKIAAEASGGTASPYEASSIFYLGVILLAFALVVNLLAQWVIRRAAKRQGVA